ncbi:MAG: cyclase family protein, partial [Acidobacteria bacterium]|nr:cyclase family protein [Acidobacteriota bacterium]
VAAMSLLLGTVPAAAQSPEPFDVLITGGRVVDGTGNPWTLEDLGIRGDRIVTRGRLAGQPARRTIDATGKIIAPGFIDMLAQSEFTLLVDPRAEGKIRQGITTEITGEGGSAAPQNKRTRVDLDPFIARFKVEVDWQDFAGYFTRLERQGIAVNFGSYVGATQVRQAALGSERRAPTPAELEQMKKLVAEAMEQGALGLSTSLVYAPANYATTEELVELAKVASAHGGVYASHMRGEGRGIFAALEETFTIARQAGIGVEIFHLKIAGRDMWGKMKEVVGRIEAARESGLDIAADQYPYIAGATSLDSCIPPWAHAGGREELLKHLRDLETRKRLRAEINQPSQNWENFFWMSGGAGGVMVSSVDNPDLKGYEGQRLNEIARTRGQDPIEALFDVLIADRARTGAIYFLMKEEDVIEAMRQPWVSVGTDYPAVRTDGPLSTWKPHPRAYGTFPRILRRYVRDLKLMSLEEAIRKMTSLAAQRVGLRDRGLLQPGFHADVVILDLERIRDLATFELPQQYSTGVDYVLVNGQVVLDNGQMTDALPGRVLRGPGYKGAHAAATALPKPPPAAGGPRTEALGGGRIVDLSYAINDKLPAWPGDTRTFEMKVNARAEEAGYSSRSFWMLEHYGTHLDAPVHFPPGTTTVEQIPAERLFGPAVVIDVRAQAERSADYRVRRDDLYAWEQRHGRIPAGALVLARTGWAARWPDAARYRNLDSKNVMHFPGFSVEAVRLLIERGVAGLGIDTFSVDYGASTNFEVHRQSHGAGLYHLENLADLSALPESGAILVVAPIKLEGGTGGPVRVFAILPE